MPPTEIRSKQIKEGQVWRSDVNITQSGEALIRRLIAGTNLSISSTGVDTGTGDVTVSVSSTPNFTTLSINGTQILDSSRNLTNITSITVSGKLTSTKANNTTTGEGQIYLNGASGNRIDFNVNGVAPPSFTTRSVGTKLTLYPTVSGSQVDYALGIESGTLWMSIPSINGSSQFKWYAGITNIATLHDSGSFVQTGTNLTHIINSTTATTLSYLGFQRGGALKGVFGNSWAANNLINGSVQDDMCIRNSRDILLSCDSGTNLHAKISTSGIMLKSGLTYGIGGVAGYSGTVSFDDKSGNLHELSFDGGILIGYSLN